MLRGKDVLPIQLAPTSNRPHRAWVGSLLVRSDSSQWEDRDVRAEDTRLVARVLALVEFLKRDTYYV